jgi:hypothetical protein
MHTIVLKSQHYDRAVRTGFGPHWPIIREHTIVLNSCLTFLCMKLPEISSLCKIYVVHRVVHWKQYLEQLVFWVPQYLSAQNTSRSIYSFQIRYYCRTQNASRSIYCFQQLCAPWRWVSEAQNMYQLVCCNIVTLIKLCALVGSWCNYWNVMHGMENAKFFCFILCPPLSAHQIITRQFKCLRSLNHLFQCCVYTSTNLYIIFNINLCDPRCGYPCIMTGRQQNQG